MIRGAAILIVLTLFMQTNKGSIFGQFSSQKGDKAQMLKYLRERLNLDGSTTVQPSFDKRAEAWIPSTTKHEQIWERKSLPVRAITRRDKSEILARLREAQTPTSIDNNAYEDEGLVSKKNDDQNVKMQDLQNGFVSVEQSDESEESKESKEPEEQPRVLWEKPAAVHVTNLQPAVNDKDGGTCHWYGEQQEDHDRDNRFSLKRTESYDSGIENWEEHVQQFFKCIEKKFWISYDKIKKKICGMFGSR